MEDIDISTQQSAEGHEREHGGGTLHRRGESGDMGIAPYYEQ